MRSIDKEKTTARSCSVGAEQEQSFCIKYTYNISNWDGLAEYNIEEFNLDTLEKKKYKVSLEATSQMDAFDCLSLIDYIDPNIINRITPNKDTNPI